MKTELVNLIDRLSDKGDLMQLLSVKLSEFAVLDHQESLAKQLVVDNLETQDYIHGRIKEIEDARAEREATKLMAEPTVLLKEEMLKGHINELHKIMRENKETHEREQRAMMERIFVLERKVTQLTRKIKDE